MFSSFCMVCHIDDDKKSIQRIKNNGTIVFFFYVKIKYRYIYTAGCNGTIKQI